MKTAIIGHTGFVGSNLLEAHAFDDLFNTSNIDQIAGREYDLVVTVSDDDAAYVRRAYGAPNVVVRRLPIDTEYWHASGDGTKSDGDLLH